MLAVSKISSPASLPHWIFAAIAMLLFFAVLTVSLAAIDPSVSRLYESIAVFAEP